MPAEKTVPISFRVTPRFKSLPDLAATRAHRSQSNLMEQLLFKHCNEHGFGAGSGHKPK
jgi:hypothetical protein